MAMMFMRSMRPQATMVVSQHTGYTVEIEKIKKRDFQHLISGFGTATPIQSATLSAEVNGPILEIDGSLRVGAPVAKGDVLCRIDSARYVQEMDRRESQLAESSSDVKQIEQEVESAQERMVSVRKERDLYLKEVVRQEDLAKLGVASEQALEQARRQLQASERQLLEIKNQIVVRRLDRERMDSTIKVRRAELELARLDIERCEIRSPISGVIAERSVEPGELVSAGTALFRIVDMSVIEIPIQIPESEAVAIDLDSVVSVSLPQDPDQSWKGAITRVAPEVDILNRTATIYVRVENRGLDVQLRLGQLVEAKINGTHYANKVIIPRRALIDGYAFIKKGSFAERRRPDIVRALGDNVIVGSGIDAGDNLIITNLEVLYDGVRVITSAELNAMMSEGEMPADLREGS